MSDYISRADAIEAVAQEWLSEASAESPYVNDDDIGEYRKLAEKLFEDVPSAELPKGELISRADALMELNGVCSNWQDDAKVAEIIHALPPAEAVTIHEDGTLEIKVPNAQKVGRVLVMDTDSHIGGGLFYPDDAEAEWIPCSERLPSDDNDYLVVDGDGEMAVGYYRDDADAWDNSCFGWLERDDEDEHPTRLGKVVAWMPLPKPYREESEVEE